MDVFGWTVQPFINWWMWAEPQPLWIRLGSYIGMGCVPAFLVLAIVIIWKAGKDFMRQYVHRRTK